VNTRSIFRAGIGVLMPALVAAALAACGGGKGDGADRYAGQWVSGCEQTGLHLEGQPDKALTATYTLTLTRLSDDRLHFGMVQQVYRSDDCKGLPIATHANQHPDNRFVLEGRRTLDGTEVERILVRMRSLKDAGGRQVNLPGSALDIAYPADFFSAEVPEDRDLIAINGKQLRFGTGSGFDAAGYPVQLAPGRGMERL
jgi:hypothetical protein